VLVSGLTTIAGFGSLILAEHQGIRVWLRDVRWRSHMHDCRAYIPASGVDALDSAGPIKKQPSATMHDRHWVGRNEVKTSSFVNMLNQPPIKSNLYVLTAIYGRSRQAITLAQACTTSAWSVAKFVDGRVCLTRNRSHLTSYGTGKNHVQPLMFIARYLKAFVMGVFVMVCGGIVAADTFHAGPLFDNFSPTLTDGSRVEALGPFFDWETSRTASNGLSADILPHLVHGADGEKLTSFIRS